MRLESVRRIASQVMKCGESRVKILETTDALKALTRDDVRSLISRGVIVSTPKVGVGRAKAQFRLKRKHLGRRTGPGRRKGTAYAVLSRKKRWIQKIRSQRRLLAGMKSKLVPGAYRRLRAMAKGSAFTEKRHLKSFIEEQKLAKK
jgi:large subunit ribosomal protein L19e